MDIISVTYIFSHLAGLLGAIMLVAAFASGMLDGFKTPGTMALVVSALSSLLILFTMRLSYPKGRPVRAGRREGVAAVVMIWLGLPLLGALPFRLSGEIPSLLDAYFESMSGFTTCGATILMDVESLSRGLHLWRSTTHWLGGMGIVVLFVAVVPALGMKGYFLYRSEVSGPSKDPMQPAAWQSAALLWAVYSFFTVFFVVVLRTLGMNWFESVCHVFGGLATGGFSPKNDSIAGYSSTVQLVIVVMMVVGGVNFAVWTKAAQGLWRRDFSQVRTAFADEEFRHFLAWTLASSALVFAGLHIGRAAELGRDALAALFQSVSVTTNTGYTTENFDAWPNFCRMFLVMAMFVGGSAGSTCGGLKVVRVLTVLRLIRREVRLSSRARTVETVRLNGKALGEDFLARTMAYVIMYLIVFAVGTLLVALFLNLYGTFRAQGGNYTLVSAFSAQATCLATTGPGLAGAFANMAAFPAPAKAVLIASMILGRLEILGVLAFLSPSLWRKA